MNVQNVCLEAVGVTLNQYPTSQLPEIAFAGKSNVGKSSLINSLINRKKLARTSAAPGKTQTINFYNVEDVVYFVDLPGYGYAKVSKAERERWGIMIEDYLYNRSTLKQVILLVDSRHRPSVNDVNMLNWIISFGFRPIVVATKTDKLNRKQYHQAIRDICQMLSIDKSELYPVSASNKTGQTELWQYLDHLLGIES